EGVEARGGLLDLTDALPRLLPGEARELAERALVLRHVEEVVTEDADHAAIVQARRHHQEGEMAFRAFAAPQRSVVAAELEVAVAARKDVVEAFLAGEELCDPGLGVGTQEREVTERATGGFSQHASNAIFEFKRLRILV